MANRGYVYVLDLKSDGLYKIGRAANPKARLSSLRGSAPFAETVMLYRCEDCHSAERLLHGLFSEKRVARECFVLEGDDFERIASVMAAPSYNHSRKYDGTRKTDFPSKYINMQGTWNERDKDILDRLKEYRTDAIDDRDWKRAKGASDAIGMLYKSHGDDPPPWFGWPYTLDPPPRGELVDG